MFRAFCSLPWPLAWSTKAARQSSCSLCGYKASHSAALSPFQNSNLLLPQRTYFSVSLTHHQGLIQRFSSLCFSASSLLWAVVARPSPAQISHPSLLPIPSGRSLFCSLLPHSLFLVISIGQPLGFHLLTLPHHVCMS